MQVSCVSAADTNFHVKDVTYLLSFFGKILLRCKQYGLHPVFSAKTVQI